MPCQWFQADDGHASHQLLFKMYVLPDNQNHFQKHAAICAMGMGGYISLLSLGGEHYYYSPLLSFVFFKQFGIGASHLGLQPLPHSEHWLKGGKTAAVLYGASCSCLAVVPLIVKWPDTGLSASYD